MQYWGKIDWTYTVFWHNDTILADYTADVLLMQPIPGAKYLIALSNPCQTRFLLLISLYEKGD
jgi:hypothetical protein